MIDKEQLISFYPDIYEKIRLKCDNKLDFRVYKGSPKVLIPLKLSLDEFLDNPIRNSVFEKLKDTYGNIKISKTIVRYIKEKNL